MKKNIVGHMLAPKSTKRARWKKLDLIPRILCLILALIVWLLVANVTATKASDLSKPDTSWEEIA